MATNPPIYGLMAEFEDPNDLLGGREARQAGYQKMDAYTPFPVEGLAEALGFRHTRMPLLILVGGAVGCVGGLFMQYRVRGYQLTRSTSAAGPSTVGRFSSRSLLS